MGKVPGGSCTSFLHVGVAHLMPGSFRRAGLPEKEHWWAHSDDSASPRARREDAATAGVCKRCQNLRFGCYLSFHSCWCSSSGRILSGQGQRLLLRICRRASIIYLDPGSFVSAQSDQSVKGWSTKEDSFQRLSCSPASPLRGTSTEGEDSFS